MTKKKILITTRDVGAAINIIEIIKCASLQSDWDIQIYIQQPASRYFTSNNIQYNLVPNYIARIKTDESANFLLDYAQNLINKIRPDIILCGLSTPGDAGIDEALIKVAKNLIPTVVMQDFWGEVNDFFGVCADYYFCLDNEAKLLTEKRYKTEGIVIGSPRHSWYNALDLLLLRSQLRKEANIPSTEMVIGLFGQSLDRMVGYQETIDEFLQTIYEVQPNSTIIYRQHPRENEEQAQKTIKLLEKSRLKFLKHNHSKVEYSLILCDVVSSILSNCLYDASYLNFFADVPFITPVALCYKPDIVAHLKSYNMIESSPYKVKNIALMFDSNKPDRQMINYLLSAELKNEMWQASKLLENPEHAAERAVKNLHHLASHKITL
jgi:hypothetical protein